jgi:glyoxylase-like metal-dependent hydrolase (beta-lactamase superfamily II)
MPTSPIVHTHTGDERGFAVNGYLVETTDAVVAVDTMFTTSDARVLRRTLDGTGKPLAAVLLTHAHPDHTNGTGPLLDGLTADVPIYALAGVERVMRAIDAEKRAYWTPIMGDDYPAATAFPTVLLDDGAVVRAGGLAFRAHDLGPAESAVMGVWTVEDDPSGAFAAAVFAGDIAYHRVHPWLAEGRSGAWLRQLERASALLADRTTFYFGHGAPGDLGILAEQGRYLDAYRAAVAELGGGRGALSDDAKAELARRMDALWPDAGMQPLVGLSADAVAAELASTPASRAAGAASAA